MEDANRKAMFAKSVFRNKPALPSDHWLANPQTKDDALSLRLAKRYSQKESDLMNKWQLAQLKRWDYPEYLTRTSEYQKLQNELKAMGYSSENQSKRDEIYKKIDELRKQYDVKAYHAKRERSKAGKAGGVYYRNAWINEDKVDTAIKAEKGYEPLWEKSFKQNVKGFDPKFTPKYQDEIFWKNYELEQKELKPLREHYDQLTKDFDEWVRKEYSQKPSNPDDPKYKELYDLWKKKHNKIQESLQNVVDASEKYDRLKESVLDPHYVTPFEKKKKKE